MNCPSCNAENPSGARYCAMCGEQLQPAGGRERRRVSVVFIDLTAFTTLTLGFDPEELRDLADEVLTVVAGVIEDYDGYVDAFRGDGLIALFGAPKSHPDDPQRAVLAAAAGLRAIEAIGRERGYPLKGRAGVNTGIVIAGSVGSARMRDYTVMGSTVNLAARLEAAAIPGEVWVGPDTYEATHHRLVYEVSPPIRLAGFPNVRTAYRLVSPLEQYDHDPYAHLLFVGRDSYLSRLEAGLAAVVEEGICRELWLVGEAGSGKTRLLREFARKAAERGTRSLWISGAPTGSSAWAQLARQFLGLQEGEEPRVRQQRVGQALSSLLPGEERKQRLILESLGFADEATAQSAGRGSRSLVASAWRDLLKAYAGLEPEPTILVIDSRVSDPSLNELLRALTNLPAPLLVVRSGRRRPPGGEVIELAPLATEAARSLVHQLVAPNLRPATEPLLAQVGGVPAYLIELGRALSTARPGTVSGSLASLLQARIDLLSMTERHMLTVAALTGERSWDGLLLALGGGNEEDLRKLLREDLLVTEAASEVPDQVAYRFQSELLRHAVLRMLPFGDRPVLHLRIAAWLEQHAPLALSELIAEHFHEGGNSESAFPHYLAAAELSARQGEKADRLYERMLQMELPPELRAQALLAFSHYLAGTGRADHATTRLDEAVPFIDASPPEARDELQEFHSSLLSRLGGGEAKTWPRPGDWLDSSAG